METSLTLLYTQNIRGDLVLLPRLYTFLKTLRGEFAPETISAGDPPGRPHKTVLLLDLGDSCAAGVWHCDATGGRSTLIVLDAMGYTAANVSGTLRPTDRQKLTEQVSLALVDDAHPHDFDQRVMMISNDAVLPLALRERGQGGEGFPLTISLTPAAQTHVENGLLHLAGVENGQVGVVRLDDQTILYAGVHPLPSGTAPDATIAGTVEFVEDEARYLLKRREDKT